jgi:hypothetical protein
VPQENNVGEGHEKDLLDERVAERVDGAVDQAAAVVERLDRNAGRQARLDLFQLVLHALDHRLGVLAGAHDDRAADDFAAVEIERAAAEIAADLHGRDVLEIDRRAVDGLHRNQLEILDAADETEAAQHELRAVFLHHLAADVEVRVLDRRHHLHQRDVRRAHPRG